MFQADQDVVFVVENLVADAAESPIANATCAGLY